MSAPHYKDAITEMENGKAIGHIRTFLCKQKSKVRSGTGGRIGIWEWPHYPKCPGRGKGTVFMAVKNDTSEGDNCHFLTYVRKDGCTITWVTDSFVSWDL